MLSPAGGVLRAVPTTNRRGFLAFLVATPTLTIATELAADQRAEAQVPGLPGPADLGDVLILAGTCTAHPLVLEVGEDGGIRLQLPRAEVGQGITTAAAMLVAEELGVPLSQVDVALSDARSELLFNQLTGGSNTIRSTYGPVRTAAAAARARLVTAAAGRFGGDAAKYHVRDGAVFAPDGRSATFGSLTAAAAKSSGSPKDVRAA